MQLETSCFKTKRKEKKIKIKKLCLFSDSQMQKLSQGHTPKLEMLFFCLSKLGYSLQALCLGCDQKGLKPMPCQWKLLFPFLKKPQNFNIRIILLFTCDCMSLLNADRHLLSLSNKCFQGPVTEETISYCCYG